jgi:lipoate-protein ligase A
MQGWVIGIEGWGFVIEDRAMALLDELLLWVDPVRRPGPEAMAVDEWLLEVAERPVLRVYGWRGNWGSVGYFGSLSDAISCFPGLEWVRRWTGGGTVDHRSDWTYTLAVPPGMGMDGLRGTESYRCVHGALVEALQDEGIAARLSTGDEETGQAACFENPVGHDVMGPDRRKLAGAGQRRSRDGLLHQGSVVLGCEAETSLSRARILAGYLAGNWEPRDFLPSAGEIAERVEARYALKSWTGRR